MVDAAAAAVVAAMVDKCRKLIFKSAKRSNGCVSASGSNTAMVAPEAGSH